MPVDKIFLMLSHAAGFADLDTSERVAAAGSSGKTEYLAELLAEAGERSIRRGLPQQYSARRLVGRSLRGRIDFARQIRSDQRGSISLCCVADELSQHTAMARLVKTAALQLARSHEVSAASSARLRHLAGCISCEPLGSVSARMLDGIRRSRASEVHQAAAFIAWLAVSEQGFGEGDDGLVFGWPTSPQQLGILFQAFVRARLEATGGATSHVSAESYPLHLAHGVASARKILPRLRTDIVLHNATDAIVIETKLMPALLQRAWPERDSGKLRSEHIAQLFTYMEHAASRHSGRRIRGLLLYGSTAERVIARFPLQGYEIAVSSIDLAASAESVLAQVSQVSNLLKNDEALAVKMGDSLVASRVPAKHHNLELEGIASSAHRANA